MAVLLSATWRNLPERTRGSANDRSPERDGRPRRQGKLPHGQRQPRSHHAECPERPRHVRRPLGDPLIGSTGLTSDSRLMREPYVYLAERPAHERPVLL